MSDSYRDDNLSRLLLSAGPVDSPESGRRLRSRLQRAHHAMRLERLGRRAVAAIAFIVIVAAGITGPLVESVIGHRSPTTAQSPSADWRSIIAQHRSLKRAMRDGFSSDGRA